MVEYLDATFAALSDAFAVLDSYLRETAWVGGAAFTSVHLGHLDPNNYKDVFVAKYGPTGAHVWSRALAGPGSESASGIAAADAGLELDGATVAVQGFGNVGSWSAHFLAAMGARVVAVSDVEGAVVDGDGLDVARLMEITDAGESVVAYDGGERASNAELLELDVDILVPAALGDVIHKWNARHVKARLIVEGANAPTTPAAGALLEERGITVVPDILANAGGVTVSYFEWVQNLQQFRWAGKRVDEELRAIMETAYDAVRAMAGKHRVSLRTAAFMVAIHRVAAAVRLRGV